MLGYDRMCKEITCFSLTVVTKLPKYMATLPNINYLIVQ